MHRLYFWIFLRIFSSVYCRWLAALIGLVVIGICLMCVSISIFNFYRMQCCYWKTFFKNMIRFLPFAFTDSAGEKHRSFDRT